MLRVALAMVCLFELAQAQNNDWNKPFPAHRIIGNVYYVGSEDLASFLIATPDGHFLINSGTEQTVPLIRSGVEKLGFRFSDIKILLESQAHVEIGRRRVGKECRSRWS